MSHNLHMDRNSGEAAIAYAGATPWHRYGQKIDEADVYDVNKALAAGHADFPVETVPMYHDIGDETTPDGCYERLANRVVIRRADTQVPLGVATNRYSVMQTLDGMDFLKGILGDGKVRIEVVCVLGEGEKVVVVAKIEGEQIPIIGDDVIEKYLMFSLGHDGQSVFLGFFTPTRVVCQNTLNGALAGARSGEQVKIRHTGDVRAKLAFAASLLKNAGIFFDEVAEQYRFLTTKKVEKATLRGYYMKVADQAIPYEDTSQKVKNRIQLYTEAHDTGVGSDLPGVRGTLWGAYNSITEVVDHKLAASNKDPLKYVGFGTGRELKRSALKIALEYANELN